MINKKEYHKNYYLKNKEKLTFRNKVYYLNNKTKCKKNAQQYTENNFEKKLIFSAKYNAKKYNVPFDLTLEDINIPSKCPLLNVELTKTQGKGRVSTNASIDRIIPKRGYIKGNIQIISEKANRMKNDASIEELLTFSKNILSLYG